MPADRLEVDRSLLERVRSALDSAWQDLHDWNTTARALRAKSENPDHDPRVPSRAGIAQSEAVILKLAHASTELTYLLTEPEAVAEGRKLLEQVKSGELPLDFTAGHPAQRHQPGGYTCRIDLSGPHDGPLCIQGTKNCIVHPRRTPQ